MQHKYSTPKKISWAGSASAIALLSNFIIGLYLARMLGNEQYGYYNYIQWLATTVALVCQLGLPNSMIRYGSEFTGSDSAQKFRQVVSWSIGHLNYLILLSPIIIMLCLYAQSVKIDLPICTLTGLRTALLMCNISVISYLQAGQRFKTVALLNAAVAVGQIVLVDSLVRYSGLNGALLASCLALVIPGIYYVALIKKFSGSGSISNLIENKEPWKYALYSWYAALLSSVVWSRAEIFYIREFSTLENVALFSVGLTIANLAVQGPMLLTSGLMPHFASMQGTGNGIIGLEESFYISVKFLAIGLMPASFGMAAISHILIPLVFGAKYAAAIPVSILLCASGSLGFTAVASALLYGAGHSKYIALNSTVGAILGFTGCFYIIPEFGIIGVVLVRILVQSSIVFMEFYYVKKLIGFNIKWNYLLRVAIISALTGLAAYGITNLNPSFIGISIAIVVSMMLYLLGLRIADIFTVSEKRTISNYLSTLKNQTSANVARWVIGCKSCEAYI